tara:strand:- start:34 stop:912 length:879 start_codon:yes stop_codon:yes gene_type:complete
MNQENSKFLFCVKCKDVLDLEILNASSEINEGFLYCKNCKFKFPIISKIPIILENLPGFIENRPSLGGFLLKSSVTRTMKQYITQIMSKNKKNNNDFFQTEKRWTSIYIANKNSSFYKTIKSHLSKIPPKSFVVEYGSSIGIISNTLGKKHRHVFGMDTSFSALLEAKKQSPKNCEYILSDVLQHPFGKKKFELIIALNLFELVEPMSLLNTVSSQIRNGLIFLSDPYDYDRGKNSVKHPLYEKQIREILKQKKFIISKSTTTPSNITWTLKINNRTNLVYKVDIISAMKSS